MTRGDEKRADDARRMAEAEDEDAFGTLHGDDDDNDDDSAGLLSSASSTSSASPQNRWTLNSLDIRDGFSPEQKRLGRTCFRILVGILVLVLTVLFVRMSVENESKILMHYDPLRIGKDGGGKKDGRGKAGGEQGGEGGGQQRVKEMRPSDFAAAVVRTAEIEHAKEHEKERAKKHAKEHANEPSATAAGFAAASAAAAKTSPAQSSRTAPGNTQGNTPGDATGSTTGNVKETKKAECIPNKGSVGVSNGAFGPERAVWPRPRESCSSGAVEVLFPNTPQYVTPRHATSSNPVVRFRSTVYHGTSNLRYLLYLLPSLPSLPSFGVDPDTDTTLIIH